MAVKEEASKISLESSKKFISCNMYTLKLPNSFTLPEYQEKPFSMDSPPFEFDNATWCFRVHLFRKLKDIPEMFRAYLVRLKTREDDQFLFYKFTFLVSNNQKNYSKTESNYCKLDYSTHCHFLMHFDKEVSSSNGCGALTAIVHLFSFKTVLGLESHAVGIEDSSDRLAVDTTNCKMSLKLSTKTLSSNVYTLKLPTYNIWQKCKVKDFVVNSPTFEFDNATWCFRIGLENNTKLCTKYFYINLVPIKSEKPQHCIFMEYIFSDNGRICKTWPFVYNFIYETNKIPMKWEIPLRDEDTLKITVALLCDEALEVDPETLPNIMNRACNRFSRAILFFSALFVYYLLATFVQLPFLFIRRLFLLSVNRITETSLFNAVLRISSFWNTYGLLLIGFLCLSVFLYVWIHVFLSTNRISATSFLYEFRRFPSLLATYARILLGYLYQTAFLPIWKLFLLPPNRISATILFFVVWGFSSLLDTYALLLIEFLCLSVFLPTWRLHLLLPNYISGANLFFVVRRFSSLLVTYVRLIVGFLCLSLFLPIWWLLVLFSTEGSGVDNSPVENEKRIIKVTNGGEQILQSFSEEFQELSGGDALTEDKKKSSADTQYETHHNLKSQNTDLLSQDLKKLFLSGKNFDLTLRVAEKEFRIHRAILMARCQFFEDILSHDLIEKNKGVVDIPDIDPETMEQLLIYVYCGKVDTLNSANVHKLYYAADKYKMTFLKEECTKFLNKSLSPSITVEDTILAA